MTRIRLPSVAGTFYPDDPDHLNALLEQLFAQATAYSNIPQALIAPHAGYIYSGLIAAEAYAALKQTNSIKNVAIFAPAHRLFFQGVATSQVDFFATPLGNIQVANSVENLLDMSALKVLEAAFEDEHALEVQLPFLQKTLDDFHLLPFIVGQVDPIKVAKIIDKIMGIPNTLIVISSDLSHYLDYQTAQQLDQDTIQSILNLDADRIVENRACGKIGIQALLKVAEKRRLKPKLIDYKNSGDTEGDRERVVGYAAIHFYDAESA